MRLHVVKLNFVTRLGYQEQFCTYRQPDHHINRVRRLEMIPLGISRSHSEEEGISNHFVEGGPTEKHFLFHAGSAL